MLNPIESINRINENYMDKKQENDIGIFNTKNINLFAYAHQNPIKFIDPDGKRTTTWGFIASGLAGTGIGGLAGAGLFVAGLGVATPLALLIIGGALIGALAGIMIYDTPGKFDISPGVDFTKGKGPSSKIDPGDSTKSFTGEITTGRGAIPSNKVKKEDNNTLDVEKTFNKMNDEALKKHKIDDGNNSMKDTTEREN